MVDNQHKKITGYRDLTEHEIALMNRIKVHAEETRNLVAEVETTPLIDTRWLSIARTDLQKGFMSLVRAVARPTTF